MNKRKILSSINKIANELDNNSLHQEADQLTKIMIKIASEFSDEDFKELLERSKKPQPLENVDDSLSVHNPKVYRIKMSYEIIDTEIKETETYLTEEKSIDQLIVNSVKFIRRKHNLKLSDDVSIHLELRAENPRTEREIWAGGYDYKQSDGEVDLEEDKRGFREENYEAENIDDGESFMETARKIMEQMQRGELPAARDPLEEAVERGMRSFPGDEYEKAYNTALEDIQSAFEYEERKPTSQQMADKAKEVAETYIANENRTPQDLVRLCDDAIYSLLQGR